ncbi:MAG: hypothetical protein QME64_05065 [bacterium]|nr:hypothetical protein [bacterium]
MKKLAGIFIGAILGLSGLLIISGIAQTPEETPYDPSGISRRERRYGEGEGKGGEAFRAPIPRPPAPAVPTAKPAPPVPIPPPTPAPTPVPLPITPPAPPTVVRGSGSNVGSVTLLFNPISMRVKQGMSFTQDIVVNNPRGTGFDTAEVMVKYSPEYLSVISFDSAVLVKTIESRIVPAKYAAAKIIANEVDEQNGIIRFRIKNETGNFYFSGTIATIHWLAKQKKFGTPISYVFVSETSKFGTSITVKNQDILGAPGDPTDGVVSATISID